mmetsp:Transcript_33725/g.104123  ORF Transcript_33725/g.104123 Transcript_33725/m.104123 type:complete len:229 (-) Transcript_33725:697-1383(-)
MGLVDMEQARQVRVVWAPRREQLAPRAIAVRSGRDATRKRRGRFGGVRRGVGRLPVRRRHEVRTEHEVADVFHLGVAIRRRLLRQPPLGNKPRPVLDLTSELGAAPAGVPDDDHDVLRVDPVGLDAFVQLVQRAERRPHTWGDGDRVRHARHAVDHKDGGLTVADGADGAADHHDVVRERLREQRRAVGRERSPDRYRDALVVQQRFVDDEAGRTLHRRSGAGGTLRR